MLFSDTPSGTFAHLWAAGSCERKRGNLWVYEGDHHIGADTYSLHDALTHLSLVCEQDRPASRRALDQALSGEAWEQPELPF